MDEDCVGENLTECGVRFWAGAVGIEEEERKETLIA